MHLVVKIEALYCVDCHVSCHVNVIINFFFGGGVMVLGWFI